MTDTDRTQWLKDRQTGIGSSDAAEILGRGWHGVGGPQYVYYSKTDPVDPRLPDGGPLRRGIDLEQIVADKYQEVMCATLTTVPLVRHPSLTWMLASHDRTRPDGRRVELKTTTGFGDGWGESGSADVPEMYRIQLQHQMAVVNADSIDLFALDVLGWRWRMYRIDADFEFIEWLKTVENEFWTNYVKQRTSPDHAWLEKVDSLGAPTVFGPDPPDLGEEWAKVVEARRQQVLARDAAEELIREYTARLKQAMGNNPKAYAGRYELRLKTISGGEVSYTREPHQRLTVFEKRNP